MLDGSPNAADSIISKPALSMNTGLMWLPVNCATDFYQNLKVGVPPHHFAIKSVMRCLHSFGIGPSVGREDSSRHAIMVIRAPMYNFILVMKASPSSSIFISAQQLQGML